MSFILQKTKPFDKNKKKPPPRPPPPNFSKYRSKSTFNLNENLIEWSPPNSPKTERVSNFGGSVSSSFSSSTSSLASSKKSFDCDNMSVSNNIWPINLNAIATTSNATNVPYSHQTVGRQSTNVILNQPISRNGQRNVNANHLSVPTIIRPRPIKTKAIKEQIEEPSNNSPPMPSVPPPSPPKNVDNEDIPYGIALYDFEAKEPNDLSFQANDIVILLKKINNDWYFGKTQDIEGMFPANFIEVVVPLEKDDNTVMALFEFPAQMEGDLALKPGQLVTVMRRINEDWLYGESNGQVGQFPSNFVERVPNV
ncbi:unnamed protein product [Phyllotreta striolata]|uniref:SH3 domain-containing protein n=1 Tax=Phyllotreta striolata TaxID=444603 RepID=A0A9N9XN65_PHYSR|nr:unnamed protein product [Phyllotreta striolata]